MVMDHAKNIAGGDRVAGVSYALYRVPSQGQPLACYCSGVDNCVVIVIKLMRITTLRLDNAAGSK